MSQLFVHVPVAIFPSRIELLIKRQLQPEIACQDASLSQLDFELLADSAAQLKEADLNCILHAPFNHFLPGAAGYFSQKGTRSQIEKTLQLAEKIKARQIIFHPGLPLNSSVQQQGRWLKQSLNFWIDYLPWAEKYNCHFCIENIYEVSPTPLIELIKAINSPLFCHVFDIGHWNIFAREQVSLDQWLGQTEPYIKHLHLHDNHGSADEHLAIGNGNVPFSALFEWLNQTDSRPTITIENHNPAALDSSLNVVNHFLRK